MNGPEATVVPESQRSLPLTQLFLVGAVVPVGFAFVDDMVLRAQIHKPNDTLPVIALLGFLVLQVGVLGILCGRLIQQPSWLRWVIYGWCWLFIDTQMFVAVVAPQSGASLFILTKALLVAQLGLVVIWGVLGTYRWSIRLPAALVAGILLLVHLLEMQQGFRYAWHLFLAQAVAVAGLCGGLRWQRFRLTHLPSEVAATELPSARRDLRAAQFGIRHVLIWTTSLALVLGLLRAFDLLSTKRLAGLMWSEWMVYVTCGIVIAMVLVVALWAALGEGSASLRWLLMIGVSLGSGILFVVADGLWGETARQWARQSRWDYWKFMFEKDWWMVAWTALAGGLLFASLLIFRTIGFRLLRRTAASNPSRIAVPAV